MLEVTISEFKAKCLALLEQVRRTRQPVRITRHGKAVAEVVPPTVLQEGASWIGSLKDSVIIKGDVISPANDEDEWEALRD